jgi:WD40 repeat protein
MAAPDKTIFVRCCFLRFWSPFRKKIASPLLASRRGLLGDARCGRGEGRVGYGPRVAGVMSMFGFSKKKNDGSVKSGSESRKALSTGRSSKSLARNSTALGGSRVSSGRRRNGGYDETDYGELFDEGALETNAEEGYDSDTEAEVGEKYVRRPRPVEGPVERATDGGFLHRQPCAPSLIPPTGHHPAANAQSKPTHELQLDFVYGYRAHDTRHNLHYNADGSIVYPAAGVGVCYDSNEHAQRFFTAHTDSILCLAMHPDGEIVATGQAGKDPSICVWSSTTCELLAELKGFHQRAVVSLSFDGSGRFLVSIGLDDDHSIAVHDWQTCRMLASSKGDGNRIFNAEYNPHDGRIVTGGVKHMYVLRVSQIQAHCFKPLFDVH